MVAQPHEAISRLPNEFTRRADRIFGTVREAAQIFTHVDFAPRTSEEQIVDELSVVREWNRQAALTPGLDLRLSLWGTLEASPPTSPVVYGPIAWHVLAASEMEAVYDELWRIERIRLAHGRHTIFTWAGPTARIASGKGGIAFIELRPGAWTDAPKAIFARHRPGTWFADTYAFLVLTTPTGDFRAEASEAYRNLRHRRATARLEGEVNYQQRLALLTEELQRDFGKRVLQLRRLWNTALDGEGVHGVPRAAGGEVPAHWPIVLMHGLPIPIRQYHAKSRMPGFGLRDYTTLTVVKLKHGGTERCFRQKAGSAGRRIPVADELEREYLAKRRKLKPAKVQQAQRLLSPQSRIWRGSLGDREYVQPSTYRGLPFITVMFQGSYFDTEQSVEREEKLRKKLDRELWRTIEAQPRMPSLTLGEFYELERRHQIQELEAYRQVQQKLDRKFWTIGKCDG
jgi:hypothetical protein